MAEVNGRLCTCDRCGKNIFRRYVEDRETDGGFTRWNVFEPFPKGWGRHIDIGLLCPECNSQYTELRDNFMKAVQNNGNE